MHKPCSSSFKPVVLDRQTRICRNTGWAAKGLSAFHSLLAGILILGGCAPVSKAPQPSAPDKSLAAIKEPDLSICAPCSRNEAEKWAADAKADVWSALKAANCYAFLVKTGTDKTLRLTDARIGRQLAESAVQRQPGSGLAHYLYAFLTGLEAENDPLHGLELVPVIEREARLAAELSPFIDHAGPDRMLGELYLRAPGMPISIGDLEKAVVRYRRALTLAPGFAENRLGLVETLLKAGDVREACMQLHGLLADMPPSNALEATWQKTLDMLKRVCVEKNAE